MKPAPLKDNKRRICCRAMSAKCIACSKGITVEELCEGASSMIPGCSSVKKDVKVAKPPAVDAEETEEAGTCQMKVEKCCNFIYSTLVYYFLLCLSFSIWRTTFLCLWTTEEKEKSKNTSSSVSKK